jgi:hypothetical protein
VRRCAGSAIFSFPLRAPPLHIPNPVLVGLYLGINKPLPEIFYGRVFRVKCVGIGSEALNCLADVPRVVDLMAHRLHLLFEVSIKKSSQGHVRGKRSKHA